MSSPTPLPDDKLQSHLPVEANQVRPVVDMHSPDAEEKERKPAPIWLQRMALLVQVMFCVYLGLLLVILPWWPHLLENNELVNSYPWLLDVLSNGAVRGVLSGIGLVDIWIGISEVIHYEEIR